MRKSPKSERLGYKSFYRRNLPHIQPVRRGSVCDFPSRGLPAAKGAGPNGRRTPLAGRDSKSYRPTIEAQTVRVGSQAFAVLEKYLDNPSVGPTWLADARVTDLVSAALHYRNGNVYRLDAFTIMPNHVHSVFRPLMQNEQPYSLSSIMHSLKRNTSKQGNCVLKRTGPFWAHESFDHYIRESVERKRIIKYVLQNPVKAGLVNRWQDWPWNYVRTAVLT